MIKRITLTAFLIFVLAVVATPEYKVGFSFLGTAVDVGTSTTATNQTNFVSGNEWVSFPGYGNTAAITITFTRAAGSVSLVDFSFQVSNDGGTTYSTLAFVTISAATNTAAVSNAVRVTQLVNIHGISHMRLYQIVNNDGVNAITDCNATISFSIGQ